jgi:hypothetical protein
MFNRGSGSGLESRRVDESFYRGIVVKNDDPLGLNRVKIYIPELSNQPFEEWFEKLDEISVKAPGVDSWSDSAVFDKIVENIPWAEPCNPLFGESGGSRSFRNENDIVPTISDGNYAQGFIEDPDAINAVPIGEVKQFNPPIKLSNYGYDGDTTPDTFSSQGIGHSSNKLTHYKSAAVTKSLANLLGLQHNDWFKIETTKGTFVLQYADTVPTYDKINRRSLPPTFDIYKVLKLDNPNDLEAKKKAIKELNAWGGVVTSFQKLEAPDNFKSTQIAQNKKTDNFDLPQEGQPEDVDYADNPLLPPVVDTTADGDISKSPSYLYEQKKTAVTDAFSEPNNTSSMKANPYSYGYAPQKFSNKSKGVVGIPEVGAKVWVFHYMGDLNFPVYFGITQDYRGLSLINRSDNESTASIYYPNNFENIV